jgi:hypothetical protein
VYHGFICSVVGPVIDVQLKYQSFKQENLMVAQFRTAFPIQDIFMPSVYDAINVQRPALYFRDGTVMYNSLASFQQYFFELPFNDTLLFAFLKLLPIQNNNNTNALTSLRQSLSSLASSEIISAYVSLFLSIKSYSNCLVCELSQLCLGGILRTIALGSTDGMSTWACPFTAFQQPVVIPVGKSALGRIFNVVGSTIDAFFEPFLSSKFSLNSYSQYHQSNKHSTIQQHSNQQSKANILSSQFLLVVGFIHYSSAAHPVYLELPQGALLSIDFAYYSLLQLQSILLFWVYLYTSSLVIKISSIISRPALIGQASISQHTSSLLAFHLNHLASHLIAAHLQVFAWP